MPVVISPNMNLTIPDVGLEPGPDYASDINVSLTTVDQHNHSFGSGVQITPTGLNINTDLSIQVNNLIDTRTVRFASQPSPLAGSSPDLGCLYEVIDDLYYNDGLGNQIRITQSGGVAGTNGSIANLTPPASAAYVSGTSTFVWESNVNTAANMDIGSIILRDITASSHGVTINPPASLAGDYSLTLPPALPAGQSFLTVDASGNITAPALYPLPGSGIASATITTTNIAPNAVTVAQMAPPNIVVTSSCGSYSNSGAFTPVTNLSAVITTSGKPVTISFQSDGSLSGPTGIATTGTGGSNFAIQRDGSGIGLVSFANNGGGQNIAPPGSLNFIDTPTAGTYTYRLVADAGPGTTTTVQFVVMVVREL